MEELLTTDEVAKILKMRETTVRQKIRDKALFAYKVGKEYRVPEPAVMAFLRNQPYIPPQEENPS